MATAIILFTFGCLGMLSIRGIMRRDASEIFAAGALAATAGSRGALLDAPDTARQTQARGDADRAIVALLAALPMMLGTGIGSELRRPPGITMVARMPSSFAAAATPCA